MLPSVTHVITDVEILLPPCSLNVLPHELAFIGVDGLTKSIRMTNSDHVVYEQVARSEKASVLRHTLNVKVVEPYVGFLETQ